MRRISSGKSSHGYEPAQGAAWRKHWFHIVFDHDDAAGRRFDLVLIVAIMSSVLITVLDSVGHLHKIFEQPFYVLEWTFTVVFTLEYVLRIAVVDKPRSYVFSFFGMVDLLAVLPTYLDLVLTGGHFLLVVRALRILRIFRVLKMARYVAESNLLWSAVLRGRRKMLIFLTTVLALVLIFGALMYLIEGPDNGFTSIPRAMYWAVVTMTTVGFGDITPLTTLGQMVTSVIMLVGYSIIAVPTGIFAAELASGMRETYHRAACASCSAEDHAADALYCRRCGGALTSDAAIQRG